MKPEGHDELSLHSGFYFASSHTYEARLDTPRLQVIEIPSWVKVSIDRPNVVSEKQGQLCFLLAEAKERLSRVPQVCRGLLVRLSQNGRRSSSLSHSIFSLKSILSKKQRPN